MQLVPILLLPFLFLNGVFAQTNSPEIEILMAIQHYHHGCRQGIAHRHPNGICGEPYSSYKVNFNLSGEEVLSLDSLKFGWFSVPVETRIIQNGPVQSGNYTLSNEPETDFFLPVPSVFPPRPTDREVSNQSFLVFTSGGVQKKVEILWEFRTDPRPPAVMERGVVTE